MTAWYRLELIRFTRKWEAKRLGKRHRKPKRGMVSWAAWFGSIGGKG